MASINEVARAILVKREAVPGTPETLTAADGIRDLREFGFVEPNIPEIDDKNVVKRTFGPGRTSHDSGASTIGISVAVPVRAPVNNGDLPPDIAELLIACGLTETVDPGVDVVYKPSTPTDLITAPAASIAVYEAGNAHVMTTARANFVLSGQPGQNLVAKFTIRAPWVDPTGNQEVPAVAVSPVGKVLQFAGAVAVVEDGTTIDIGSIELDFGAELEDDITNVGARVLLSDYKPVIRINPKAVATVPEWDKLTGDGEIAITATWDGMVISAPACQMKSMGSEGDSGQIRRTKEWQLNETTGDDQFTITFTAPA